MNGLLVDRWAAKTGDNKPWIELKFNNTYNIQRIDLYPSCKNVNQCRELEFIFSDGTSIKVNIITYILFEASDTYKAVHSFRNKNDT